MSICWVRYAIALSIFWVKYSVVRTKHGLRCFFHNKKAQFRCMILDLRLFVLVARTISLSLALEVLFELKRQRFYSAPSNTLCNRFFRSAIICIRPIFIGSDGFECSYLSLLSVAAAIVVLTVRFGKWHYHQFPTLQQAQQQMIMIELCSPPANDRCGAKSKRSAPLPTPRLRRKSFKATIMLQVFIILSLPSFVTAPNTNITGVAAASSSVAPAAVIGSGVAASSVVYYDNFGHYSNE